MDALAAIALRRQGKFDYEIADILGVSPRDVADGINQLAAARAVNEDARRILAAFFDPRRRGHCGDRHSPAADLKQVAALANWKQAKAAFDEAQAEITVELGLYGSRDLVFEPGQPCRLIE